MTKEKQTGDLTNGQKGDDGITQVNFILPPRKDKYSSDENNPSDSIKKEIKNIIDTFGKNTKQELYGGNVSEDLIPHSQVQNINNGKKTVNVNQKKNNTKKNEIEDVDCSESSYSMTDTSSSIVYKHSDQRPKEKKHIPQSVCQFCASQMFLAPGNKCQTCNHYSHYKGNEDNVHYFAENKVSKPNMQRYASNQQAINPNQMYNRQCNPIKDKQFADCSRSSFRYHDSHKYFRPESHKKASKVYKKYSSPNHGVRGPIGNFVHNMEQWYNNLKSGEGDQEIYHRLPKKDSVESLKMLYKAKIEKTEDSDPELITFKKVKGIPKFDFKPEPQNIHCQFYKNFEPNIFDNTINKDLLHCPPNKDEIPPYQGPNGVSGVYMPTSNPPERIDIYYFDHGNAGYFRTTDRSPPLCTELLIQRSDEYATKFWAEIFGACHLFITFFTSFLLQFFRFLLHSLVRTLAVGTVQLFSDYFFKPLLSIAFNGFIQPIFILFYNMATSFKDLCEPLSGAFGLFIDEIAKLLRAIRLVDVNTTNNNGPFYPPVQPA